MTQRFLAGRFLGEHDRSRRVGGCVLHDTRPTVPAGDVEPHVHEDAHFLLLLGGAYRSSAAGMPPLCTERALIVNPPGTAHRDHFDRLDGRFFTVSIPAPQWAMANAGRSPGMQPRRLSAPALVTATRAWRAMHERDDATPLLIEGLVDELLDAAAGEAPQHAPPASGWLVRARQRLDDDWRTAPTMHALAREADVHPVYFARAFRRAYGCSPGDYLRRRRLQVALGLLHDHRHSLAVVAAECGFVDQAHFTRAFGRHFRLTPARYRDLAGVGRGAAGRFGPYKTAVRIGR